MEVFSRARRVGGSIMVRIPPEILEQENIQNNEVVKLTIEKAKKDWFGVFKGAGKFTKHDELNTHE
ncbi:AbrB/MazE/SpoVT family DNA-binding domain-containing protein [Candidatus Woesearchaeota archaeon]|nr:AbrB/MazE/SpoVT family DNA-binding domain-containing protein [Candidatus Woesearchaeota archaeon]